MSEQATTSFPGEAVIDPGLGLTPEAIEAALQEFRNWLHQAAQSAADRAAPTEPEFSWQALVAEFTALRQEVNLQTRAARAQLEQNAEALQQLDAAGRALDEVRPGIEAKDQSEGMLRPLLKTLVDIFDALALARREVERVQTTIEDLLNRTVPTDPEDSMSAAIAPAPSPPRRRWWPWRHTSGGGAMPVAEVADLKARLAQRENELAALRKLQEDRGSAANQASRVVGSILVGYNMGLQRLERALTQHDVEPIDCVGELFDPECMEVVDVVTEPGRQGTEVLEEVRRGYRWRGRLFRPAQVRVARS